MHIVSFFNTQLLSIRLVRFPRSHDSWMTAGIGAVRLSDALKDQWCRNIIDGAFKLSVAYKINISDAGVAQGFQDI